jgi:hypothetical protein
VTGWRKVSNCISFEIVLIYFLMEVSRVNWFRAKARNERWDEELKIVENEMKWTIAWFLYQEERWKKRVDWAREMNLEGHRCYAEKQVYSWEKMRERCQETWK